MTSRELVLKNGLRVVVDSDVYEWASRNKWYISTNGYVVRKEIGSRKTVFLHLVIMGGKREGFRLDHRDMNPLNNLRSNLRWSTQSQNLANRNKPRGAFTSKFKGVYWHAKARKWVAQVKKKNLGLFAGEKEAAAAYNAAAIGEFGDFARLNEL